ncbi:hypothetical protein MWU59_08605 [Flavobacteriaceae bacterium F08102]|nr:hypothetical protein [Flavobacteriaceae bacterium F08102]
MKLRRDIFQAISNPTRRRVILVLLMVGPEGEKHWGKVLYISIVDKESFKAKDGFCDVNGTMNKELPQNY